MSQRTRRETGIAATPTSERAEQHRDPRPRRGAGRQQPERQHERDERRRVVEQPEPARRLERHVVGGLPVEHPRRGRVVGEEVVAQRVARDGERQRDPAGEHEDRDQRQQPRERRPDPRRSCRATRRQPAGWSVDRAAARRTSRWTSGIRNRSQATRIASRRPGCIREPRRSAQRIGHDRVPVAAPADEVDHLHVEHDARDLLAGEHVARDVPPEALEPALGVLDRARPPTPTRAGGTSCPAAAASRAATRACPSRRAGSASRRRRRRLERLDEQRQLVGRRGHVGVGEHDQVARRRGACPRGPRRPCRRAGPSAARARRRRARAGPGRARRWRRSSRRRRRGRGSSAGSSAEPGRPSRASAPRRRRYPNSSSSAGPSRASSL